MPSQNEPEELRHLALYAMQHDQPERALDHLKALLAVLPEDANAHYLLGAVYAQIGMYGRAIEQMSRAVELDPALHPAHFQLGLLHATSGDAAKATAAWTPLDALDEQHPLRLFKRGLEHLLRDEFEPCIALLTEGIARNQAIPSLNADMRKVINSARQALGEKQDSPSPSGRHFLLSSYEEADDEEPDAKD